MSSSERQRSRQRTRNLLVNIIKATLQKPEKLTVSQWAEKYRILDESSNFSGRWSNDITPYLVGLMDAFNDPYIQEINFCKSTQVGGTEAMLNMLGWIIMNNPSPTMIVYPSDDLAKDTSNDRLKPSLTKTPDINERFYPNSSKELNLKTFTYSKKIYTCSTPTLKTNYVWQLHEEADEQRNYFVPCPHCGEYITFVFKQIKFPKGDGKSHEERAKDAVYVCQECGCIITDKDKIKMLRRGEWRDVKKSCVGKPRKVSFWINALYSRFLTWSEIALEFLTTKDDPDEHQNFVNSWLAEPWEDTKLKTSADLVMERQTELPEFVVPNWTKLLTGGVDVQQDCMYWTIRAWGDFMTSQNIAHGQVRSFGDIEKVMNLQYMTEDGMPMVVNLCLIDSGYDADNVYEFCAYNSDWALPCKGSSGGMKSHFMISSVNKDYSKAYGMNLIMIDGGKYKDMIAGRLHKENGRGSWMVYKGCDLEYADQVTSEHKVSVKNGNGKTKLEWVPKHSHTKNHLLDCEVYAMAAADTLGLRTLYLQNMPEPRQEKKEQYTPEEQWIQENEDWV